MSVTTALFATARVTIGPQMALLVTPPVTHKHHTAAGFGRSGSLVDTSTATERLLCRSLRNTDVRPDSTYWMHSHFSPQMAKKGGSYGCGGYETGRATFDYWDGRELSAG